MKTTGKKEASSSVSLSERIFSLETEYGIQFYSRFEAASSIVVPLLIDVIAQKYGIVGTPFLINGSKLHPDVGHPEWSLPECRSAHEATKYDKAADHLLRAAIPVVKQQLNSDGYEGHLIVFKNNFDSVGNTFGCHENYLMQRNARMLSGELFVRYLVRCLVPFLVTRPLLCGAGMLRVNEDGGISFELSQRSQFIEAVVSEETTVNRAIVNLGRETQSLSPTENRRLHLIVGDSNVSGWSTWMKLGVTGLVLHLIEDLYFNDMPLLADPVGALRAVSSDADLSGTITLRDGKPVEAVDIQWKYYDAVCDYSEQFGISHEEEKVLESWGAALEELASDNPSPLRYRADWAIKKKLIDAKLESLGYAWDDYDLDKETLDALRAIDMRYHDISADGYFTRIWPDDTLVTSDEIKQAQSEPPPFTRANVRGKAIRGARAGEFEVKISRWTDMKVDDVSCNLRDPLQYAHPSIPETCSDFHLDPANTEIGVRAIDYMGRLGANNLESLSFLIKNSDSEVFRHAAIKAVAEMDDCDNVSVLIDSLENADIRTQWVISEALERSKKPKGNDKWGDASTSYDDDDEPLVNLT